MPLKPGTRLGPYEVIASIGAGGMGEVYRARDTRLGREVAVKVLPEEAAEQPERLRRFEQEARSLAALEHPHIVALHDFGVAEGHPYIVSELLAGQTLRERLRQGDLSVAKSLELTAQTARGLAAAHAKGIVHRDVKPENLFVSTDGRIKILDFGLAKLREEAEPDSPPETGSLSEGITISRSTRTGAVLGTPAYLAPEQLQGKAPDHRADIFALGVVLYEALAGRSPFRRDSAAETMAAIVRDDPPPLSAHGRRVPPVLEGVVRRCLEKRPEERFQSAHDLALALESLAQASSLGGEDEAPPRVLPARRRVAWVAAGALIALSVGAAFLWGRWSADRSVPRFQRLTFRRGDVGSARFSPDGQTVFYSARWGGQPAEIFSVRLDGVESRNIGLTAWLAATTPGRMGVVLPSGTLAEMPLEGGVPREICEHVASADWAPDGTLAITRRVAASDSTLGLVLSRSQIELPPGNVLYTPGSLAAIGSVRVSPRGDRIAFIERPSGKTNVAGSVVVMSRLGQRTTLSGGWTSIAGLAWSPDGREVWFTATKSGVSQSLHAVTLVGHERLVAQVGAHLALQDISRDGRVLLTQGHVAWEARGGLWGDKEEQDYSWLDGTAATLFSPDGRFFVFNECADGGGSRVGAYLRRTDGSPPVRLGDGVPLTISPDGKWVVSLGSSFPRELRLVPTGPGEARALQRGKVSDFQWAYYLPDGKRIVVVGSEKDRPTRLWVQDLPDGEPRPFTQEGTTMTPAITPDGRFVAGFSAQAGALPALYPVASGPPRPIPGITVVDMPLRFSPDGRFLFAREAGGFPARVARLDLATGRRRTWLELAPPDRSGVALISVVDVTPDGRSYLYNYWRSLSDLYVVTGLR
jgi:Tol biopolymer transport system component